MSARKPWWTAIAAAEELEKDPSARLARLGWGHEEEAAFAPYAARRLVPARVARVEHRGISTVYDASGAYRADARPRRRDEPVEPEDYPGVGDWVAVSPATAESHAQIEAVLPRRTAFVRAAAGASQGQRTQAQVVAANVDVVFIVEGLDTPVRPRRLERYLATAWQSGAQPVILLTKADVCHDLAAAVLEAESVAFGVPVVTVSAVTGEGMEALAAFLTPGATAALLGLSGVGKSTLVNALSGFARMKTAAVREDGRGRHTTTYRELVPLDGGALLIDTPGMRELLLWDAAEGLEQTFGDVEELAADCRFNDCVHETEPGCAVQAAIRAGRLDRGRLESYRKLQRELRWVAIRHDERAKSEERKRWRNINREARARARRV